jgi:hypothetical protein
MCMFVPNWLRVALHLHVNCILLGISMHTFAYRLEAQGVHCVQVTSTRGIQSVLCCQQH